MKDLLAGTHTHTHLGGGGGEGNGWLIDLDLEFSSDVFNHGGVTLYLTRQRLKGFLTLQTQRLSYKDDNTILTHTHTHSGQR